MGDALGYPKSSLSSACDNEPNARRPQKRRKLQKTTERQDPFDAEATSSTIATAENVSELQQCQDVHINHTTESSQLETTATIDADPSTPSVTPSSTDDVLRPPVRQVTRSGTLPLAQQRPSLSLRGSESSASDVETLAAGLTLATRKNVPVSQQDQDWHECTEERNEGVRDGLRVVDTAESGRPDAVEVAPEMDASSGTPSSIQRGTLRPVQEGESWNQRSGESIADSTTVDAVQTNQLAVAASYIGERTMLQAPKSHLAQVATGTVLVSPQEREGEVCARGCLEDAIGAEERQDIDLGLPARLSNYLLPINEEMENWWTKYIT